MTSAPSTDAQVFICWSGDRSHAIAERVCELLQHVVPGLDRGVFVSSQIQKGARWFDEIERRLDSARAGIVCLTPENLDSPWLHFEAGALARQLATRTPGADSRASLERTRGIFLYAHGVPPSALGGPLSQYQSAATTREDTLSLLTSLADRLGIDDRATIAERFNAKWIAFDHALAQIHLSVPTLVPEFERWFRRKTFDEPLEECADQNWSGRYDGARQTHDRLTGCLGAVRQACARYQVDLFEHLTGAVESYAMAIRGLLLRAPPFPLGGNGTLRIDAGIRAACEKRRMDVKEIVSRILDPRAVPSSPDAACFWITDSFELRKMMVHRLEHRIDTARDEGVLEPPLEALDDLFASTWALDRIHGYLAVEKLHAGERGMLERMYPEVRRELESANANRGRPSLMALHYALGALKEAFVKASPTQADRAAIASVCKEALECIEQSRPAEGKQPRLDRRGQVRRTIEEIEALVRGKDVAAVPGHGVASGDFELASTRV